MTLKRREKFEAVKLKLKGEILKLKNTRDKCPKEEEEEMRHPLAFHAEGKKPAMRFKLKNPAMRFKLKNTSQAVH